MFASSLTVDRQSIFPREEAIRWLVEDFTVDCRERAAKQKADQKESGRNRIPQQGPREGERATKDREGG